MSSLAPRCAPGPVAGSGRAWAGTPLASAAGYPAGDLVHRGPLGDVRAATTAFHAATPALTGPKPRALALLDHAQVLVRGGHVSDGCALATEALRIGRDFGSERITAGVRAFRAALPARASDNHLLDDRLTALYEEDTQ